MKHLQQLPTSPRLIVKAIDLYTSEHGPQPILAELARTRRQNAVVSFFAGVLSGALLIVTAFAIGGLA